MFEGKMLRELAGIPIRRIDLANSELALAEPDPLTLANLTTKSLTLWIAAARRFNCEAIRFRAREIRSFRRSRLSTAACRSGLGHVEEEFAHVPRAGRAALGAQAAMQADILVLSHDAPGLQRIPDIEVLLEVEGRGHQPAAQILFAAVFGKGDAIHRADVDAGVAFDAQGPREHGLHVAIETPLGLEKSELLIIAELDFNPDVLERDRGIPERHLVPQVVRDVVVVAPLMDTHLLADQGHPRGRPVFDILAVAQFVDRNRRVVAVRDRPDDVLWPESGIATKKHIRQGR